MALEAFLIANAQSSETLHMKVVHFERSGRPAVLRVKEVPNPSIRKNDTLIIQVAAAGLNIYDTWRRRGIPCYLYDLSISWI